ncbi:hypothetical protein OG345_42275 (plasmid) [Streptomyces sp. NBC_01220]|uniref:hypothetical protein n=1 Tax=Streptomyces sp. NBC_01220 TaxID=2903781 RepID=UPI00352E25AB|nr:hypothetical protein OG345_42275 [Streptomyces sp. NBC_01220]
MPVNPDYWRIVTNRAADYTDALRNDPGPMAGLHIIQSHAMEYGLARTAHIAQLCLLVVVDHDAQPDTRTVMGTVDVNRLVPPTADALTILDNAAALSRTFAFTPGEAMAAVEEQIAAVGRARQVVQTILNGAPQGIAGRQQSIDALWELRDDPRALCAVLALTTVALRAVQPLPA